MPYQTSTPPTDFRNAIMDILNTHEGIYSRSLEEYLRSLWAIVKENASETVSYPFFIKIISEAFETEPLAFDQAWLIYEKELFWDFHDGSYTTKKHEDKEWKIEASNVDPFEILRHTLLCQIADLHKMQGKQLSDPYSYFGINAPSGNRWYNFDVFTYWECATAGMESHLESDISLLKDQFSVCTWATLAMLLRLGQIYE